MKVAIDSPPAVFKPEMLVDVTFVAPKLPEAVADASDELRLYVPQQVIQRDECGACVWLADQSAGVAHKAPVTTGGAGTGGLVEVTGGLTIASRIISRGHDGLVDGHRIRVVSEEADNTANNAASTPVRQSMSRLPQEGK